MIKRRLSIVAVAMLCACADAAPTALSDDLLECAFGSTAPLEVGSVQYSNSMRAVFCIDAPDGGSYATVPFAAGAGDTARVTVSVFGGGLAAPPTSFAAPAAVAPLHVEQSVAGILRDTDAFDHALRAREVAQLPVGAALGLAFRSTAGHMQHTPEPGDLLRINVSTECSRADTRLARVTYVTDNAIVAVDPTNPRDGGFTEEDWRLFADQFDQLIVPVLRQNFGRETDIDGNGRTILYFSRAVNELGTAGIAGIVAGFFWRGDLFPRAGLTGVTAPCAGSNEGEILFFAVPDPAGEVRGVPVSARTLRDVMVATIAHEFQHLVNSGQRLYVTKASVLEDVWLNEALSFIAEELMFYAAAGLTPGRNIDVATITATERRREAFSLYAVGNLGRFNVFLQAPQDWSAIGRDAIATRGASWSLLRYVADRDPRPDAELFRALVGGRVAGLANLAHALGRDPLPWLQDWALSVFTDDLVPGIDARFEQPSWNMRELIAALRIDQRYPLRLLPMVAGEGFSVRLQPGSAAYPVFAVPPQSRAIVVLDGVSAAVQPMMRSAVVRIR